MSLWVSLHRIERKPFLTLPDFLVANYHEAKDNILSDLAGIDELDEFPSESEMRRYIGKEKGEDKQSYYERALQLVPEMQEQYQRYQPITMVLSKEQDYLETHSNYEELFFQKRCYELANTLRAELRSYFKESDNLAIVLDEQALNEFNVIAEQTIVYEEGYVYKLFVG